MSGASGSIDLSGGTLTLNAGVIRGGSSMLTLDPMPFELSQVTASAVELLGASAREKAIELAFAVAPDVPEKLIGDQDRLRQILLNLTGNAIKFTDEGSVKVEVFLEADTGDHVSLRFEVSDTGIGLGDEAREKLFDKFTQADL